MPIGLAGKTAIVTGAGRGIGKAVAEVFAREGARVLVVNRSAEAGQAATDTIAAEGFEASFLQADVRRKADMERMAQVCIERYGRIDIL
ncbi:MAG: SDR family NAD(P)-dependent oxidoreductase, partial [Rhodospirillales bacterium]|nr:SDR family NAD(P)-dependent oxidoreductase [Rhodospirillales bacterium]